MYLEFLKKFKESVLNMNEVSLKLINHGLQLAVGVCLIGLGTYIINKQLYIFNFLGEQFGMHIMLAGGSLFTQFIIGGIILDIIQKRRGT